MSSDDRLAALEMRSTEQERVIDDMSGQIAEQWTAIEKLQKRLDTLTGRFLVLEEQSGAEDADTKPPHW
jgi:SlyX protein